ncbi:unnamed protein product [Miscanthus lutarioriparius]|uniref:Uncharacterized protein n=1 Tax=Miscanthus lutarioriparius TaxID=422564 RepID=A0A811MZL2_9POAL|nr:unnamed protein product [Miscanthus lutarioriparius]
MTSRISKIARKSVVIIADKRDEDAYCSGCVIMKDGAVTVIASSDFVKRRERRLKVVFFDREELEATVVIVQDSFCLLRTAFHPGCEAISLLEDEDGLIPSTTFMFAPISQTANQRMSTFATVESLASYGENETDLVADSTKYFLVSCPYSEKTRSGLNRLTAAPVFTLRGKTAGIVLQDCRDAVEDPEAAEVKVILKASHVNELMKLLPPAPLKRPGKKRKRSCH